MRKIRLTLVVLLGFLITPLIFAKDESWVKGIYLQQATLENQGKLAYLIKEAKKVGINTFIIDMERYSKKYAENIRLVHENKLRYVARIVVFPQGGETQQVHSLTHWQKKLGLVKQAYAMGANEIQLDYIRYNTKRPPSSQHAKDIHQVISWFKIQTSKMNMALQIAVFGETSFKPSLRIGQDVELFADTIDGLNPMLYPSHYYPYDQHSKKPYETVASSLRSLQEKFQKGLPFKLYPYIEMYNFRYPMPPQKRVEYILAQIRAVQDSGAHGWYAWSAGNQYKYLFEALSQFKGKQ